MGTEIARVGERGRLCIACATVTTKMSLHLAGEGAQCEPFLCFIIVLDKVRRQCVKDTTF